MKRNSTNISTREPTIVQPSLLCRKDLGPMKKLIVSFVESHNPDGFGCMISSNSLAEALGSTQSTIDNVLGELIVAGELIRVKYKKQRLLALPLIRIPNHLSTKALEAIREQTASSFKGFK